MVSHFIGERPGWIIETLFTVGIVGSFLFGLSLCLTLLFSSKNPRKDP